MPTNPYEALFEHNTHAGLPVAEQQFRTNADNCATWVAEHGRLPTQRDGTPGQWLVSVRCRLVKVTDARRDYMDQVLPGWDAPSRQHDDHFFAQANACAKWAAEHDRLPKYSDPHGIWLSQTRSGARGFGSRKIETHRIAHLDRVLPGWDEPINDAFFLKVDQCATWAVEHGRLPKSADKPWGQWLSTVRNGARNAGGVQIDATRRAYLDQVLPGWDAPGRIKWRSSSAGDAPADISHLTGRANRIFRSKVYDCAAWVAEHGRFPTVDEPPSGRWLNDVRNGDVRVTPERRALLDEHLPGWNG